MQNNEQSLLCHRENYVVPKGQEQSVHCKIAKMDGNGNFFEKPRIVRYDVKEFETYVKDNLESMGYSVEILHHPMGRYNNVEIVDKDEALARQEAEIAELKLKLREAEGKSAEKSSKKSKE